MKNKLLINHTNRTITKCAILIIPIILEASI